MRMKNVKKRFFVNDFLILLKGRTHLSLYTKYTKLSGFTLLELLIALAILSISAISALHVSIISSSNRAVAYQISAASNLAQAKLEDIMSANYGSVVSTDELNIDENAAAGGFYRRTCTVTTDSPISGTKTVRVDIIWTPVASGISKTITLWTIKGQ
ncbi:MAG: prepilin-type N-terminal cleavage/methylation domain-containing protein [Candidatus Omnitrophota bacterium]